MNTSVIVITLNRPEYIRRCLDALREQTRMPDQVIVVDASPDDCTQNVVGGYAEVLYLRNAAGSGRMTTSRNIGLRHAVGDIIAFIDDDAFAEPFWMAQIAAAYTGPEIGAVGGRVLGSQPPDEATGLRDVGRLRPDGILCGYFAVDTGAPRDVDHIMGCNMSFRRDVLAALGGFREDYPGISGICEDSDMSMRVKRLGRRIVFAPAAVVDHVGAPQARGSRFDLTYAYYVNRNHTLLLVRNFGLASPMLWRFVTRSLFNTVWDPIRRLAASLVRFVVLNTGSLAGLASGVLTLSAAGVEPVRRDAAGAEITRTLSAGSAPCQPDRVAGDSTN